MTRIIGSSAALIVVGLLFVGCAAKEQHLAPDQKILPASISMHVEKISDQQWDLRVELVYTGDAKISVNDTDLPWGFRDSLLLVLVVLDEERTKLPETYYIDDPIENVITLKAGDKRSGTIYLYNRFPALTSAAKDHDLLLFWSYELVPVDGPALPRLSGAVVIPRQP